MSFPTYSVSLDTLNGAVAEEVLHKEVVTAGPYGATFNGINVDGDVLTVLFDGALTSPEQTTIDGVVAAHDGVHVDTDFVESTKSVGLEFIITEPTDWQVVDGLVTSPSALVSPINKAIARVIGSVKTIGTGFEMRVVETTFTESNSLCSTPYTVGDLSGAWTPFVFNTDVTPTAGGPYEYTLEARLNGATSASVRYVSMSLLKLHGN